jgi:hypothetical protein
VRVFAAYINLIDIIFKNCVFEVTRSNKLCFFLLVLTTTRYMRKDTTLHYRNMFKASRRNTIATAVCVCHISRGL